MQRKIGVIVVSYHNTDMTTRYVTKELTKLTTPYTLVVVNVAATREDSQRLADACGLRLVDDGQKITEESPRGYVIWDEENLGYARGNNKGVRFLNTIGTFTHYLFSNDDIEIDNTGVLEVMCDKLDSMPSIAGIGPRILGTDGRDQNPHDKYISPYRKIGWRLLSFLRKKKRIKESWLDAIDNSRPTYWVQGSFMMINANDFNIVGGFDSDTFLYFEEAILAERFKKIGKGFYYESSVKIIHYECGSSKQRTEHLKAINKESAVVYYKKYKKINTVTLYLYTILCKE